MIVTKCSTYPKKKVIQDMGTIFAIDDCVKPFLFFEERIEIAKQRLIKSAEKLGANEIVDLAIMPYDGTRIFVSGEAVILEDIEDN